MNNFDLKGGTRELSRTGRRVVMWLLVAVSAALLVHVAYAEGTAWVLALTVVVPLAMVVISLAVGKASKGNGLFGSTTLYVIAFVISCVLTSVALFGKGPSDLGIALSASWVPAVIFILARKRRIKERGGWVN